MPRIVPAAWMPDAAMKRVIPHWTAGAHHASTLDREHYHLLIEGDGRLVRGEHAISDNVRTSDGDYAAHTRNLNAGSIGVALCCMGGNGVTETPYRPGPFPLTLIQWQTLAVVLADLCERYHIPITPQTVLGHGEVEATLGIAQRGKWDPCKLPWAPSLSRRQVGDQMRDMACDALERPRDFGDARPVTVLLDGQEVSDEGVLLGGAAWVPLRPIADARQWAITEIVGNGEAVRFRLTPDQERRVEFKLRGDRGYVPARALSAALELPAPRWDAQNRTVRLGKD